MLRNVLLCHDPEVLSQSFFILSLSGMRPHLSPVTIYTLFHHKVLWVKQTHTHPCPISCLIQTCLMSPLTDPHRLSSTHAHRHSITGKQRRPHINPSSKASTRPFPMRMRCPKALWCYLASAKARMWSMPPPNCCRGRFYKCTMDSLKGQINPTACSLLINADFLLNFCLVFLDYNCCVFWL